MMKKAQLLIIVYILLVASETKGLISIKQINNCASPFPTRIFYYTHVFILIGLKVELCNNENVLFSLQDVSENKFYLLQIWVL